MVAYSKPNGFLPILFALIVFVQATVALHGAHHQHQHIHQRSKDTQDATIKKFEKMEELEKLVGLQKRANNIAIKGASNSPLSPRLEIRDLQRNTDQWNLYLLGMQRFQAKPKNDRESYYQIAGVHGRPFITWNNFGPLLNNQGFCPHAHPLFGSWHRPYLAIFEQALLNNVQEVINEFPSNQQASLRNAARTLRMPYFDWARDPAGGPTVPTSIRDKTVTVNGPRGRQTIDNPLYSYSWGSSLPPEMQGGPWGNFATTLRRPVNNPTRSNNNEMEARFRSLRQSLANRVYNVFMSRGSWGAVSTAAIGVRVNGGSTDSIEGIHDTVHVTAGGESGGHMFYLDFSAFDPFFWLHHTNVDRLLAMYQVVSPNTYMASGAINHPMAQWNTGEWKNSYTPLKPFTKDTAGNYYTSEEVRQTSVFSYYYPETGSGSTSASVTRDVTRMYGPSGSRRKRSLGDLLPFGGRPFRDGDYQTVLSVIASKYALDGSMTMHCFIGKPANGTNSTAPFPTNSTSGTYDFTEDPNYVGAYAVMGHSGHANLTEPVMTEGCLPLTSALQEKEEAGELKSLHPKDVEPYLAKNLNCKVYGAGDKELDADKVPDLHISVKSCKVTPSKSDSEFPSLGEYVKLPDATKYLPAGGLFEYIPTVLDKIIPHFGEDSTFPPISIPTGVFPFPSNPESEQGYCQVKQVIKYVDPSGKPVEM